MYVNDRKATKRELPNGERMFSVYCAEAGEKFYVITEWDKSVTNVLLPEDNESTNTFPLWATVFFYLAADLIDCSKAEKAGPGLSARTA
jgi:hypothetical protein